MGGWILTHEDEENEYYECAVCSNPKHNIIRNKKTGKETWGEMKCSGR